MDRNTYPSTTPNRIQFEADQPMNDDETVGQGNTCAHRISVPSTVSIWPAAGMPHKSCRALSTTIFS
jgi:hypothetical protein